MENNAWITIDSRQYIDGEGEKIYLATEGVYAKKNGSIYLIYESAADDIGDERLTTTVKITPDGRVCIMRGGDHATRLLLERGVRHLCRYGMGCGEVTIGIFAEAVDILLDENGGEITLKYSLDIESELISRNKIVITVKGTRQGIKACAKEWTDKCQK